jgi:hypothetical protein
VRYRVILLFAVRDVAIINITDEIIKRCDQSKKMISLDGLSLRLCGFCTHLTRNLDIMQFLRAFGVLEGLLDIYWEPFGERVR